MNEETKEQRIARWRKMNLGRPDEEVRAFEAELEAIKSNMFRKMKNAASSPDQLSIFSWLPTKAARCSIFSPIADKDLKSAYTEMVFSSSWGRVEVSGPPLNMTDEGVFLSILMLARKKQSNRLKIVKKQICEILGISIHSRNYNRIKKAIIKLWKTSFLIETKSGKYHGERLIEKISGTKDFAYIEIDKWFFDKFLSNEITNINMQFRQSLKGDVAKALYRFLCSHRGVQRYKTQTLIDALNMKKSRDLKLNRLTLKRAFTQLKNKKYLDFKYDAGKDQFYKIDTSSNRNRLKIDTSSNQS